MSMPAPLAEVVSDFAEVQGQDKLKLLLEFANDLPALPADMEEAAMEPVPECQSPVFLHVDASDVNRVRLHFSAPAEAPTTRGFASILAAGLDKQPAADILAVPADFYTELGLAALVSPLRLRGLSGMLARIKRRLRELTEVGTASSAHGATLKLPPTRLVRNSLRHARRVRPYRRRSAQSRQLEDLQGARRESR